MFMKRMNICVPSKMTSAILLLLLILALKDNINVDAHGHVTSPRSRNYRASIDRLHGSDREYCPHCLNRKVDGSNTYGSGLCGVVGSHNYDQPSWAGSWNSEETYEPGQVIMITSQLTAYHGGHFEIGACAATKPTQACFDANKLVYVGGGFPVDTNYQNRAYLGTPAYIVEDRSYSHEFQLPPGLVGEKVLLQWRYFTANSCSYAGYGDYFAAQEWASGNLGSCDESLLDNDGGTVPERFWNCMEVLIVGNPTPPSPIMTKAPTPNKPSPTVTKAPTKNPPTSTLSPGDSRLIAYVGNWLPCPTTAQTDKYTHIMIAFAVTYTWSEPKNQCNTQCNIGSPVPICNNQANPGLVNAWQDSGKKVILSFGGAGMGGSWAGDKNDCWDHCFGRENSVIDQLDIIVRNQNFDGVDIDYEYFYNTIAQQQFLETVTIGLREKLPEGKLVTHAPMDSDLTPDKEYYKILKRTASSLDFIMPQYYNGVTRPAIDGIDGSLGSTGQMTALSHYTNLVDDMFGGDATKILFGFCISDCSGTGSNANSNQAAKAMRDLKTHYNCNGGAFFWESSDDSNGSWSLPVNVEIIANAGCSDTSRPPTAPSMPVKAPTTSPTSSITTKTPSLSSQCESKSANCGPGNPCINGMCCSEWGYCGTTDDYCGECCQSNCGTNPTPPEPSPTPPPETSPTPPPTPPSTTPLQCENKDETCGPGNPCSNGMCCSEWGHCGTTDDYCGECCQSNCGTNPTPPEPSPTPPPTPPSTTPLQCENTNETCGPANPCSNGMCCSEWGHCGTTDAYCGECCQSNCGKNPVTTAPTALTNTPTNIKTLSPSARPSKKPVSQCVDLTLNYKNKINEDCTWVASNPSKYCTLSWKGNPVLTHWCPLSCGICTSSESCTNSMYLAYKGKSKKNCGWVSKKNGKGLKKLCNKKWKKKSKIAQWCPNSCNKC